MDLEAFSSWIAVLARKVGPGADAVVAEVAGMVHRELVKATPIDTGFARANWQVSTDSSGALASPGWSKGGPRGGVARTLSGQGTVSDFPSGVRGSTASAVSGQALQAGQTAISGYSSRGGRTAIYIFNNAPYIVALDQGHSKQAPAGFIEATVIRVQRANPSTRILEG